MALFLLVVIGSSWDGCCCKIDIILGQFPRYETIKIPNGVLENVGRLIITATVGAGGRNHAGGKNFIYSENVIYSQEGAYSVDGGTSFVDIKGIGKKDTELYDYHNNITAPQLLAAT